VVDWFDTHGDFPRDFNLMQDENYLIIANQNTDNVTVYKRNSTDGTLALVQKDIFMPEGTCVLSIG
jgi:6-phosphogluconolactonase